VAKNHLKNKSPRYLLINTGCANAGTGKQGLVDAEKSCEALALLAHCDAQQVLPFSTGVIGEFLPLDRLVKALPQLMSGLSGDRWMDAAQGIMTTDTREKIFSRQISLNGKSVTVTGIAKGAGMIKPNMATMLAYVATDAAIGKDMLKRILKNVVNVSFNRITIDGDTSTNDACVLIATNHAENDKINSVDQPGYRKLKDAIESVFLDLAQAIIRDAEGATKFITLVVSGGMDDAECLKAAYAVAESPLVKTAFFASDPNWGRIVAAIGRCGIRDLDSEKVRILLNDVLIVDKGGRAPGYKEEAGQQVMDLKEIVISIHLGRGTSKQTVWTCDLSHDYVRINAEYRS
jgi:glutamate N-acetyltransferase/amino-acid N-acetyltransferase